jgi:hypothetical protein
MTRNQGLCWRAGFITLFWAFLLGLCLYIWYYIYLFVRWAICG